MFLLPLGLEDAQTDRKPFITYGIIVSCVIVWIASVVTADAVDAAFERAIKAWIEHPYVVPPRDLEVRISPNVVQLFEEAGAKMDPTPEEIYEHQQELDTITAEILAAEPLSFSRKWGLVPARGFLQIGWLSNIFIHFGFFHLFFNLLFFWIVARALEDRWGHLKFLGFYLAAGVFASACHFLLDPGSERVLGGASGAIAGCIGAFCFAFPTRRVKMFALIIIIPKRFFIPGWVWSAFWFVGELSSLSDEGGGGSVAVMAHIGGWLFGFGAAAAASFVGSRDLTSKMPALAIGSMVLLLGGSIAIFALPSRIDTRPTGSIMIDSKPAGASITIDGGRVEQKTPYTIDGLRLGRATLVTVDLPEHRSRPTSAILVPRAGATAKRANFDLTRIAKLEVRSEPAGARISVDGRNLGVTPLVLPPMDVGRDVKVEVSMDDYLAIAKTIRIEKAAAPLELELVPSRRLTIETEPPNAKITIDGRDAGTSPMEVDVPKRRRFTIVATKPGFKKARRRVRPREKKVSMKLKSLPLSSLPLDDVERERLRTLRGDIKRLDNEIRRQKRRLATMKRREAAAAGGTNIYERLGSSNASDDLAAEIESLVSERQGVVEGIENLRLGAIERLSD